MVNMYIYITTTYLDRYVLYTLLCVHTDLCDVRQSFECSKT